ncbi:DUF3226 domain-containing protein [Desulfonema magnum]|uniref:Uncharacterized protein n=1 Tax=Desulfonema magnum TaxID=45655 RepID=A0A975BXW4_9BACT|nr:DUF3226 domain-containing protein [Desulfonema magnum]QTA93527.1 Uncharacterized protein dnm_096290 [Desulfonema magnum]
MQKLLLVEGIDDKKVIEKLLKKRKIAFEDFEIKNCEGMNKLLNLLPTTIKTGTYEVVGIIVDSDDVLAERWQTLKNNLDKSGYENIPTNPNPKGIILSDEEEELPKIGIWLMPNNQVKGTIEDFVRFLVPDNDDLLPIAKKKVDALISTGKNRFTETQKSKAIIHTWLAWQERPGTQLGNAITYRFVKTQEYIVDDGKASDFVKWLKKLFR